MSKLTSMPESLLVRSKLIILAWFIIILLNTNTPKAATVLALKASSLVNSSVDLRQDGPIQISGYLVEGGTVYLTFPIKNYGSTASPAIHPYTEGYTSQNALWRADGAQPTAVVIQPGETVTFQVQHDLWYGHVGTWSTYGAYLWDDSTNTYYGPLNPNGYNQAISFEVAPATVDLRQDGPIQISGTLIEGGIVYLSFSVKNYGSTASPAIHPYTEGYTSQNALWRADGAQPTAVAIQPGETVTFQVQHDLWYGHVGTWSTYGAYLWDDSTNTYYGPLNPNGYSQTISFEVSPAGADLRQEGPIEVFGSLFQGGKVFLQIPVKNYGSTASPAIHPYTEGYTPQNALWRADEAQPTAVVIQPGETVIFQVQHDLWYGHVGTWSTYGTYLWDDSAHTYYGPLNPNGYNQAVSFEVFDTRLQSLDIRYMDNSNEAIDVSYEVVDDTLPDGSIIVNLTVRNKVNIPYMLRIELLGPVSDGGGNLEQFSEYSQGEALPILPNTTMNFENVRFEYGSSLEFYFPMFGYDDQDITFMYGLHGIEILSIAVLGFIPSGDAFETYENLIEGELGVFAEAMDAVGVQWFLFGTQLGQGQILDALSTLLDIIVNFADELSAASGAIFRTPIPAEAIRYAPLSSVLYNGGSYLWDLAHAPGVAQVTLVPSPRPAENGGTRHLTHTQSGGTVIASSSEQGIGWEQIHIIDNDLTTGWASGGDTPSGEWIVIRLPNNTPMLVNTIEIHPGPTGNDHTGAALRDFHIDISVDGINFTTILQGTFNTSEIGQTKTFQVTPAIGEYIRLVIENNQSNNAVSYVNIAEISVSGFSFSAADDFEPDSNIELAALAGIGGLSQVHNFHYPGDEDWYRLQTIEGEIYQFSSVGLDGELGLLIEFFDMDGDLIFQIESDSAILMFEWIASVTEDLFIKFSSLEEGAYGESTTYSFATLLVESKIFLPFIGNQN